jgi:hypothetical protein
LNIPLRRDIDTVLIWRTMTTDSLGNPVSSGIVSLWLD